MRVEAELYGQLLRLSIEARMSKPGGERRYTKGARNSAKVGTRKSAGIFRMFAYGTNVGSTHRDLLRLYTQLRKYGD